LLAQGEITLFKVGDWVQGKYVEDSEDYSGKIISIQEISYGLFNVTIERADKWIWYAPSTSLVESDTAQLVIWNV